MNDPMTEPSPSPSQVENQRIASNLAALLDIGWTGQPDLDFATLLQLINRHVVELARVELAHGGVPAFKALAEQVIRARENETRLLEQPAADAGAQAH